jgi:hypothetical protein
LFLLLRKLSARATASPRARFKAGASRRAS